MDKAKKDKIFDVSTTIGGWLLFILITLFMIYRALHSPTGVTFD
jgi:hypothetical protein